MVTPDQYMRNILKLRSQLNKESKRIIYAHEREITSMNIEKIDDHIGSDGQVLRNLNRKYSGRYTLATQLIASVERPIAPKTAGDLYNWTWTGDFIGNFRIKVSNNGLSLEIYSTGEGSGLKKDFFNGYKNLYGLTKEDQYILNYDLIYPDLMTFINQYI